MARVRRDHASAPRQLTLDDWAQMLNVTREPAPEPAAEPEPVAVLAEALAPRLLVVNECVRELEETGVVDVHRCANCHGRTVTRALAKDTLRGRAVRN